MVKNRVIVVFLRVVLGCFLLGSLFGTFPNFAHAADFSIGDTVEVYNTNPIGLSVRDTPAGNFLQKEYDGALGVVIEEPIYAALEGTIYTWWRIRYQDGIEGWSAEGDPGVEDWLKKKNVLPSTKFQVDDSVTVTASTLYVRTDPPELEYKSEVHNGDEGIVKDGPFYGVPEGSAGLYYFWKIDYGSITGWSVENYIEKATSCTHSCWDRSPLSEDELANLVRTVFDQGGVTQTGESVRVTAYAVARAESGGNPSACGDNDKSIGLWQINIDYHDYDRCRLFEEDYNANAAKEISNNGEDWNLWCTWEQTACGGNGDRSYRDYLPEARKQFYPKVTSFSVSQSLIVLGETTKFYYSVSDDVGLDRVELWRTSDQNGSPDDLNWKEVKRVSISGNNYSSDFDHSPDTSVSLFYLTLVPIKSILPRDYLTPALIKMHLAKLYW